MTDVLRQHATLLCPLLVAAHCVVHVQARVVCKQQALFDFCKVTWQVGCFTGYMHPPPSCPVVMIVPPCAPW